jgi:para-nitrobenzyl esterase
VTINYRVGLMGSYVHPELTKESGHNSSGNYAVLDMIAALQWIHRNIGAFGGDAGNVTIFGQSSGAGSVTYLLGAPLAKGLFHRAICESSGGMQIGRRSNTTLANAEKAGLQFAEKVGANSLAELRAKPAAELIKAGWNVLHNLDSWVQPDSLDSIFAAGKQNDVPILAGSNSDEGATVVRTPVPAVKWGEQIKRTYGSMADGYLMLYPAGSDQQAEQSQRNEARDVRAWLARGLLRMQNKTGKSKTYSYFFSRNPAGVLDPKSEFPTLSKPGAAHAAEIVYVFNNLDTQKRPWQAWDRTLADMMSSYWVNFAKTGDPNGNGLPNWPAYDAGKDLLMHFGDKISVEQSPLKKVIDAVDRYYSAPGNP